MNTYIVETCIKTILQEIGENPDRPGLKDTPQRVRKMYEEIFRGYSQNKPILTTFDNNDDGIIYDDIIIDTGQFYSQCEHHLATFSGSYYFGYIPDKKVIGLSKIARLVDYFGARLQIQERLGRQIINEIEETLKPKGCILLLEAHHTCKAMRGIRKDGKMTTVVATGIFRKESLLESKFISLIK